MSESYAIVLPIWCFNWFSSASNVYDIDLSFILFYMYGFFDHHGCFVENLVCLFGSSVSNWNSFMSRLFPNVLRCFIPILCMKHFPLFEMRFWGFSLIPEFIKWFIEWLVDHARVFNIGNCVESLCPKYLREFGFCNHCSCNFFECCVPPSNNSILLKYSYCWNLMSYSIFIALLSDCAVEELCSSTTSYLLNAEGLLVL